MVTYTGSLTGPTPIERAEGSLKLSDLSRHNLVAIRIQLALNSDSERDDWTHS